ncbi:MAG TPA: hypothetical protein VGK20_06600 [Candidatus Binatia bacterium]
MPSSRNRTRSNPWLPFALVIAVAVVALPLAAGAAGTPDQSCRAAKLKSSGKYAGGLLGCAAKGALDGSAPAADCVSKSSDKVAPAFDSADLKNGAPCNGLVDSSTTTVETLATDVEAAAPPVSGGGKCPSAVYKAAGKLASAELGAWSKFVTSGDGTKRDATISTATVKFGGAMTKAETQAGCTATGQADAVRGAVEDGIAPLLDCIIGTSGSCAEKSVAATGSVSTDSNGSGADPANPVTAVVETPNAGAVELRIVDAETVAGYDVLGHTVEVTAPDASAASPLILTFTIDASIVPVDFLSVTMTRNGAAVADCSGAAGVASPDPCIQSRVVLPGGDLRIVALSSHASSWSPVAPVTMAGNYSMRWQMHADKVGSDVASEIDAGWKGRMHNLDPVDGSLLGFRLDCPSTSAPFGDCTVAGFDSAEGNCRCANDSTKYCNKPYESDSMNCGGAACTCFTRPPTPASISGVPVCMLGTAATNATGTWSPDDGHGHVKLYELLRIHLGYLQQQPCPVCVGDPTPNDGVRGGTCDVGNSPGAPCDANGTDPTFPPPSGGATSLDCLPSLGLNITGQGMKFSRDETTSSVSLSSNLPCSADAMQNCPCAACSSDTTVGCSSDAQCATLGYSCSLDTQLRCTIDDDCASVDVSPCNGMIHRCQHELSRTCTTNSDCTNVDVGPCKLPTCDAVGSGEPTLPNDCPGACNVDPDGEGVCADPSGYFYCDGFVEEDGRPIIPCSNNTDCQDANNAGACTIAEHSNCFAPTIAASGIADPASPRTVAAFCAGVTANVGANSVAGLPGPVRIRSDWSVTYAP